MRIIHMNYSKTFPFLIRFILYPFDFIHELEHNHHHKMICVRSCCSYNNICINLNSVRNGFLWALFRFLLAYKRWNSNTLNMTRNVQLIYLILHICLILDQISLVCVCVSNLEIPLHFVTPETETFNWIKLNGS